MKSNRQNKFTNSPYFGFTIIELLVVMAVMGIIATIFLVNFASLRGPRNLKIGQNELVSNLRQLQSYTISERNAPTNNPAKFYSITFNATSTGNANTSYATQVVDKNNTVTTLQVINLPTGVSIDSIQATTTSGTLIPTVSCLQIAFSLPFGTIYGDYDATGNCNVSVTTKASIPSQFATLANLRFTVTLKEKNTNQKARVIINGVAGTISSE